MPSDSPNPRLVNSSPVLGGILIVLGILLLLVNVLDINLGRFGWPFFIIVPGILLFVFALAMEEQIGKLLAIVGSIVTMAGLLLLYQNTTDHWESWAYAWALVCPASIGFGQIIYGSLKSQEDMIKTGTRLAIIGIAIFLIGVIFFELVIGISGFGLGHFVWPLLLIGLGLSLILHSLLFGRRKV